MSKLLSLCLPTNGISEWVFPVLDSIYSQGVDNELFEVVVTDNGDNVDFYNKMIAYAVNHDNLIYKKTTAKLFLNEIESYRCAQGLFVKFVNHRTIMLPGSIRRLLDFIENNQTNKPVIYFSNGMLNLKEKETVVTTFEEFVKKLNYWSSWSTGMAFWKEDFDSIPKNIEYNELFPHTTILFSKKEKNEYIIDDNLIMYEMPVSSQKKGKYDLFYAFAVEYPSIILDLERAKYISYNTFLEIKDNILTLVTKLYWMFFVRRLKCSYDLSSYKKTIKVYYSRKEVFCRIIKLSILKLFKRGD